MTSPLALTEATLAIALTELAQWDPDLAAIIMRLGPPPLWARPPGFPTLIHIILEQQVSLASARAAFDRLLTQVSPLTPEGFLALTESTLRVIGFSRQKSHYSRLLAIALVEGQLDLQELAQLPDEQARTTLVQLKGIGPWSADIYLLMALGRPDIWPVGDLALQIALQQIKQLPHRPTAQQMHTLAEPWRPWRAVAARLLWHHYLSR